MLFASVGASLMLTACQSKINAVTASSGSTGSGSNVTSWTNSSATTTVTAVIPDGNYSGNSCLLTDSNLVASNIASGVSIFGVTGNYTGAFDTAMASSASRDPGTVVNPYATTQTTSSQLTLQQENTTYATSALPTTGGYDYRDIPDDTKDGDGYYGMNCGYAPRPTTNCGGTTQSSVAADITDCATKNPTTSTWNGATDCNGGQGEWKLVARDGANKEVWQDERTGLLWSSEVSTSINWCQASGNTQEAPVTLYQAYNTSAGTPIVGNGTIGSILGGSSSPSDTITIKFTSATAFTVSDTAGTPNCGSGSISAGGLTTTAGSTVTWSSSGYCSFTITQGATNFASGDTFLLASTQASSYSCAQGAGLQPASPISYCAEAAGLNPASGETWSPASYFAAKGAMGQNSTPSVRWRLPTISDYELANVDGIRMVMPDTGIAGTDRPNIDASPGGNVEWSASVSSSYRNGSWFFNGSNGSVNLDGRNLTNAVRCVGR